MVLPSQAQSAGFVGQNDFKGRPTVAQCHLTAWALLLKAQCHAQQLPQVQHRLLWLLLQGAQVANLWKVFAWCLLLGLQSTRARGVATSTWISKGAVETLRAQLKDLCGGSHCRRSPLGQCLVEPSTPDQ